MSALALLAVAATAGRATDSGPPDPAASPPRVEAISVRLLDPPDPHARLTVQYAPDPRLEPPSAAGSAGGTDG